MLDDSVAGQAVARTALGSSAARQTFGTLERSTSEPRAGVLCGRRPGTGDYEGGRGRGADG